MSLIQSMNLYQLNNHIKSLVCSERQITNDVLKSISELDSRRGYLELGFSSLFSYLTQEIGYSESAAQRRISAARLMNKVDSTTQALVCAKLKTGELNLTHIAKAGSLIQTLEKKNEKLISIPTQTILESVLPKLEGKDSLKSDQIIADILTSIHPNLNPKKENNSVIKAREASGVTLTLKLTVEQHTKLKKVMALKSHSVAQNDIVGLFEKLLDQEINKMNVKIKKEKLESESDQGHTTVANAINEAFPSVNAKTSVNLNLKNNTQKIEDNLDKSKKRKYISIQIKRRLLEKAGHQCQYISPITGKRCEEKHYLSIDHTIPLAVGGADNESNYKILCSLHNLAEARRMGLFYQPVMLRNK